MKGIIGDLTKGWKPFFIGLLLLLVACKGEDACESVLCENNGTCIDGECLCQEGFAGINCGEQLTPEKVLLTKIAVSNFPDNAGNNWDPDGNPDIYVRVMKGDREVVYESAVIEDADSDQDYEFVINPGLELELNHSFDYEVIIELLDYDDAYSSRSIHGIICPIYEEDNKFPASFDCWYQIGENRYHFVYELGYVF